MPNKYTSKLRGQRVLVLGGTSGIGFCVAEAALEHEATVIISGSRQENVDKKIKELKESYPDASERIFGRPCDLSDQVNQELNILALYEFATEGKTKKLDHVVNTAGDRLINPPFSELTMDVITKAQTVRIFAPLMLIKHAETYLNKSQSSSITFTSGAGTYKPASGWTLMPTIGGALEGLIRAAAVNLAPTRVNGIAPGPVMTRLFTNDRKLSDEETDKIEGRFSGKLLAESMGAAEDIAEAYIYLMKNRFVTGQMAITDGGLLLK